MCKETWTCWKTYRRSWWWEGKMVTSSCLTSTVVLQFNGGCFDIIRGYRILGGIHCWISTQMLWRMDQNVHCKLTSNFVSFSIFSLVNYFIFSNRILFSLPSLSLLFGVWCRISFCVSNLLHNFYCSYNHTYMISRSKLLSWNIFNVVNHEVMWIFYCEALSCLNMSSNKTPYFVV